MGALHVLPDGLQAEQHLTAAHLAPAHTGNSVTNIVKSSVWGSGYPVASGLLDFMDSE